MESQTTQGTTVTTKPTWTNYVQEPTQILVLEDKGAMDDNNVLREVIMGHNLQELSELDLKHSNLITGVCDGKFASFIHLLGNRTRRNIKEFNELQPARVMIEYPFDKGVQANIFPYIRKYEDEMMDDAHLDYIGYYAVQIAKAYAEIYSTKREMVGVWGHEFGDLFLESILIHPNNELDIRVGS